MRQDAVAKSALGRTMENRVISSRDPAMRVRRRGMKAGIQSME
jgi:hypothetical protein